MYQKFLIKKPTNNFGIKPFFTEHKKFLFGFVIIVTFGLTFTRWFNIKYQNIYQEGAQDINNSMESVKGAYINLLSTTDKPADVLLFEGISLIDKNQIEIGLITLEKAVSLDPNYRDGALYTGYTNLRLAQEQMNQKTKEQKNIKTIEQKNLETKELKNSNLQFNSSNFSLSSSDLLAKAKEYLEKARDIDPLYAKTHEYLAVVYDLLGDSQNADLSRQRAKDFSK